MGFFSTIKDKTISFIGEKYLKQKIERYGTMLDLKIDSEKKEIFVKVNLKGESTPLELAINNYSILQEGDENFLLIESMDISREWMNLLAEDLLKNKKIKLPEGIASTVIKMFL